MPSERTGRVYKLADPRNGVIRYVGATSTPLSHRLSGHCSAAGQSTRSPVASWVRELLLQGVRPIIDLLEEVVDLALLPAREKHHIADHFNEGWPLLNVDHLPVGYYGIPLAAAQARADRMKAFGGLLSIEADEFLAKCEAAQAKRQAARDENAQKLRRQNPECLEEIPASVMGRLDGYEAGLGLPALSAAGRERVVAAVTAMAIAGRRHGLAYGDVLSSVTKAAYSHQRRVEGLPVGVLDINYGAWADAA